MNRDDEINEIQEKIAYHFNNINLLERALIHRSYGNENWKYKNVNNEKLELLGDAVLDLIVTEYLYLNFEADSEGELAKLKAMIVSEPVLAGISQSINLGKYLLLSKGEEITNGREKESILGDAFEALLGSIYLDSGFENVKRIALKYLKYKIDHVKEDETLTDYKTIFQEYTQKEFKKIPEYSVIEETGPDHSKSFKVVVKLKDKIVSDGIGKNKKMAEQMAAKNACKKLEININETL